MSETSDHTLEMLRPMRAETADGFADVQRVLQGLIAETRVTKGHIVALVHHEHYAVEKLAERETRLSRVEKRPELNDPNPPE